MTKKDFVACRKRPYGVKSTCTFAIDQRWSQTKHLFEFDADDSIEPVVKKEFVRFY